MKRAVAALIALALLSCGALAEERSFAFNREQVSDIYSWDGALLTEPGTYLSIYSVTNGQTRAEDELFAAQSTHVELPEGQDYAPPRYALLDAQGRQLTDFLYESIDYSPAGDALIYSIDGQFGAMSRSLEELVPAAYDAVSPDGEGGFLLVSHEESDAPPLLYMPEGGEPEPTGVNARFYSNSMIGGFISAYGENGLYGFLTPEGRWAVKPKFDWAQNFVNGYAIVKEKGKTGIIDTDGKWAVKPSYDDDRGFLNGGEVALMMRGTRAFLVRPSDGKQLFSLRLSKDGYVIASDTRALFVVVDKKKATLYNTAGERLFALDDRFSFDLWGDAPEDRVLATSSSECTLFDLSGNEVLKAQGLYYLDTADGRALYIASRFKTRTIQYDGSDPYEEAIYGTYRCGVVDSGGNSVLPVLYRQLYMLIPGRYYAEDAERRGVIDAEGKWIVSGSLYDQLMD